ncbi:MAG: hypothetical protein ACYCSN_13920 [Acidobacteriaceae bacterium]
MTQITTPISLRISGAERDYLADLAEAQGISIGQAAMLIIQQALQDGRDMSRLVALENRIISVIQTVPQRTAELLVQQ